MNTVIWRYLITLRYNIDTSRCGTVLFAFPLFRPALRVMSAPSHRRYRARTSLPSTFCLRISASVRQPTPVERGY